MTIVTTPVNTHTTTMTTVTTVAYEEYELLAEIGSGSYKTVYKAVWKKNGASPQIVALGVLRSDGDIAHEASIFDKLGRHEHLTRMLALTKNEKNLMCLVTEYASRGALDTVIMDYAERGVKVTDEVLLRVCMQVSSGMMHLGQHGLIHRDLAARNVLVFQFHESIRRHVHVKISDYGEALVLLHESFDHCFCLRFILSMFLDNTCCLHRAHSEWCIWELWVCAAQYYSWNTGQRASPLDATRGYQIQKMESQE
jgi:serine/threonine protein kinase